MVRAQLVRFRNLLRKFVDRLYFSKKKYCCICNKSIGTFFSYRGGKRAPLMVALSELRRVLKVGGYAILQTPFSPKITKTFSDPRIKGSFARYHAYGQDDHVRLYGNDKEPFFLFERIDAVSTVLG